MLNRRHILLTAAAAGLLTACGQGHSHSEADHGDHGTGKQAGMSVTNALVTPPLPGRDIALGTFTLINNSGQDDVLLSASAPISGRTEIHTHIKEGDVMKMRRLDNLAIADGDTVMFERGGYHLMMFKSLIAADVTTVPVTLTFEKAGAVIVEAAIDGQQDGHSHGSAYKHDH